MQINEMHKCRAAQKPKLIDLKECSSETLTCLKNNTTMDTFMPLTKDLIQFSISSERLQQYEQYK